MTTARWGRVALRTWAFAFALLAAAPGCGERLLALDPVGADDDDDDATDGDGDGDGFAIDDGDCDDGDATVYPGAPELCDDVDHDCDGVARDDDDGDGADVCDDCDDTEPAAAPGLPELCDGLDNDCDGVVPADEADADGDAFRLCHGDCDDGEATTHPAADEVPYDGVDNDCDGADLLDADGDGFDWDGAGGDDCDDGDPDVYPGAHESPEDGVDTNCDGEDDPTLGDNCYHDSLVIGVPETLYDMPLDYDDATDGPSGEWFYFDDIEFDAAQGDEVHVSLRDANWYMDPYLYVLDPMCQVLAADDNGGSEDDAYLELTVPIDGIYTIIVTTANAFEIGWYTLETW